MRYASGLILRLGLILLVTGCLLSSCVHKPKRFTINYRHDNENVVFEHQVFSKGPGPVMIGDPRIEIRRRGQVPYLLTSGYDFSFYIDDLEGFYYAYLSIETWEVEQHHKILLNGEFLGFLKMDPHSLYSGSPFQVRNPELEAVQMYIPRRFFKAGKNTLTIKAHIRHDAKSATDSFGLGDLDIVIVHIRQATDTSGERVSDKRSRRHFPDQLQFFSKLTDEEIFIATVKIPTLVTELNLDEGIYRKRLSYVYSKIGDYYRWRGDYIRDIQYQTRAVAENEDEERSALRPYLKSNLALAYYYMGDYEKAITIAGEALFELKNIDPDALKVLSAISREDTTFLEAQVKAYLAHFHLLINNTGLAEDYAKQALDVGWTNWPVSGSIAHQVMGDIAVQRGELDQAALQYHYAIRLLKKQPEVFRERLSSCRLSLANTYYVRGEFKKATEVLSSVEDPTHEFLWRSYLLQGMIAEKSHRPKQVIQSYKKSIEAIESSRETVGFHEFKITFMDDKLAPYHRLARFLIEQKNYVDAYYYAEKTKARAFLDLISGKSHLIGKKNDSARKLTRQENALREHYIALQNRLDNERRMFQDRGVDQRSVKALNNARKALEDFYLSVEAVDSEYAALKSADALNLHEFASVLPPAVAVVNYYYLDDRLYVWTLNRAGYAFVQKSINSDEMAADVRTFRDLLLRTSNARGIVLKPSSGTSSNAGENNLHRLNRRLGRLLLEGVFDKIQAEKVYVIPHGILHYLPFQALGYKDRYLAQQYQVGYIPSSAALKYVFDKRKDKAADILALGNPDLGNPNLALPFSESEVADIKRIFPDTRVLVNRQASEAQFKKLAGRYPILHVASHGEFNADAPLLSCLRLTPGDGEDGRLETREIFDLDLNAYLVTLSACNTAMGKMTRGDELLGLSRAFIYAGTPTLLGTIWSVNDESTSEFMKSFYANLKKADKLHALQITQNRMINSADFRHPFYWAGFQLIGDYH